MLNEAEPSTDSYSGREVRGWRVYETNSDFRGSIVGATERPGERSSPGLGGGAGVRSDPVRAADYGSSLTIPSTTSGAIPAGTRRRCPRGGTRPGRGHSTTSRPGRPRRRTGGRSRASRCRMPTVSMWSVPVAADRSPAIIRSRGPRGPTRTSRPVRRVGGLPVRRPARRTGRASRSRGRLSRRWLRCRRRATCFMGVRPSARYHCP